jgi:hypothetical protein
MDYSDCLLKLDTQEIFQSYTFDHGGMSKAIISIKGNLEHFC